MQLFLSVSMLKIETVMQSVSNYNRIPLSLKFLTAERLV